MNPIIYLVIIIMPSCHIVINRDPFLNFAFKEILFYSIHQGVQ